MKKICMIAYTNYLSDARPRREAETLVLPRRPCRFHRLGEKNRPRQSKRSKASALFRVEAAKYRGSSGASYLPPTCAFCARSRSS